MPGHLVRLRIFPVEAKRKALSSRAFSVILYQKI
jgi:hypothetical protein